MLRCRGALLSLEGGDMGGMPAPGYGALQPRGVANLGKCTEKWGATQKKLNC